MATNDGMGGGLIAGCGFGLGLVALRDPAKALVVGIVEFEIMSLEQRRTVGPLGLGNTSKRG